LFQTTPLIILKLCAANFQDTVPRKQVRICAPRNRIVLPTHTTLSSHVSHFRGKNDKVKFIKQLTRFQDGSDVEFTLHDIHVSAVLNKTVSYACSSWHFCENSDSTDDAAICKHVHLTVDVITLKLLCRWVLNIVNTSTVPNVFFYFMDSLLCFADL
jgi:hypothetical protein